MKLECNLEKLKNGIIQAEKITGKNLTLPVLNSVLIEAFGKNLKLKAINLNLGIEINIPAKIEKEGKIAINGAVLLNIFNNLFQEESVFLEEENTNLIIKTKKNKIKLKSQSYEDFPNIPTVEGESFEIESKKVIEGFKSVYYSSSVSDIKPEISSVFVYSKEDVLFFVATDSFRLAEKKIKTKNNLNIEGILIPQKNINDILRVFGDLNTNLKINFNKNQISFLSENIYLTSRIIDGVFPDYTQIIPKEFKTEAVVLKQDLLNALKISNVFLDKINQINLSINIKNKILELYCLNNNIGENKTNIDAVLNGEDVNLSFNYKYLMESFPSINTDSLSVKLNDTNKPIVITPISDNSFLYLIMPMNK